MSSFIDFSVVRAKTSAITPLLHSRSPLMSPTRVCHIATNCGGHVDSSQFFASLWLCSRRANSMYANTGPCLFSCRPIKRVEMAPTRDRVITAMSFCSSAIRALSLTPMPRRPSQPFGRGPISRICESGTAPCCRRRRGGGFRFSSMPYNTARGH